MSTEQPEIPADAAVWNPGDPTPEHLSIWTAQPDARWGQGRYLVPCPGGWLWSDWPRPMPFLNARSFEQAAADAGGSLIEVKRLRRI
ncbi:hypothetical protein [Saccharothrix deserti]|uniref:hypothetical protein n=1 Tax=Saccharothrix deserti TaxID=2593674 RepID=UPI00131AB07F|nr:hypothetical protein [Saccharothrix deserti]